MALQYSISSMCCAEALAGGPAEHWLGSQCGHLFRQPRVHWNYALSEQHVGNEQHLIKAPFTLKSHHRWEVLRHILTCVDTCGLMCLYSKSWLPLNQMTCEFNWRKEAFYVYQSSFSMLFNLFPTISTLLVCQCWCVALDI